jgi:hypothetical protein
MSRRINWQWEARPREAVKPTWYRSEKYTKVRAVSM